MYHVLQMFYMCRDVGILWYVQRMAQSWGKNGQGQDESPGASTVKFDGTKSHEFESQFQYFSAEALVSDL